MKQAIKCFTYVTVCKIAESLKLVLVKIRLLLNNVPNRPIIPSPHHNLVVFHFIIYLKLCMLLNNIIFGHKQTANTIWPRNFIRLFAFSTPAGMPVSWIMIAPSVTPKKTNIGSNNPAMRLYKFDTDTGQVSITVLPMPRGIIAIIFFFCLFSSG